MAEHRLNAASVEAESVMQDFLAEMENGLAGRPSSLAMIPTFIDVDKPVPAGRSVIVVDAGGTNVRVGTVKFDESGSPVIGSFSKHRMPGIDAELTKKEFFEQFAALVLPVADKADAIGFCFSYAAEISPDCDGKLVHWTKEVMAPEVEGEFVGANLAALLAEKGYSPKITVLNDTVATLLAARGIGQHRRYGTYIGLILGTGTNTAYAERNANITKRDDLSAEGDQVINIESGNFAKCPRTEIDAALDGTTDDAGAYMFEKMISGAYRGGLCLRVLTVAAEDNLLSAQAAAAVGSLDDLSTVHVSHYLNNPFEEGPFLREAFNGDDRRIVYHLFHGVVERAAVLTAINLAAVAVKTGAGTDPLHPICINADGSTFHKVGGFQSLVEARLRRLLEPLGICWEIIHMDEAPFIGAAVAGLTR